VYLAAAPTEPAMYFAASVMPTAELLEDMILEGKKHTAVSPPQT